MSKTPAFYDTEAGGEFAVEIEGDVSHVRLVDAEAILTVDDVSHALVGLSTVADTGGSNVEAYTRLYPEEAEQLGLALIQAADYAKRQEADDDA
ncbi:hypothetical protein [Halovenus salina]|uniref:Uncharacterized protein n=1 Tax=Halovenus salina TaxID=1510225 RepID=A0ABD5VWU2_9EURY|nr:hypothetical protein [Halovenus salina]